MEHGYTISSPMNLRLKRAKMPVSHEAAHIIQNHNYPEEIRCVFDDI